MSVHPLALTQGSGVPAPPASDPSSSPPRELPRRILISRSWARAVERLVISRSWMRAMEPAASAGDAAPTIVVSIDDLLGVWRPIDTAVDSIAETLGAPAVDPFEPMGAVVDQLAFVHRQVAVQPERHRFHATR